jgi:dihydrofolate reductase
VRKLILQIGPSIDGFVAARDGGHEWGYGPEDDAVKEWKLATLRSAGAHLMGRPTYEAMAAVWPTSSSVYAAPMNDIPKIVFSSKLASADWPESRIARGDLGEEIARLKREPGDDLLAHGGPTFARALVRRGVVALRRHSRAGETPPRHRTTKPGPQAVCDVLARTPRWPASRSGLRLQQPGEQPDELPAVGGR